jgi:hypothetical protein
MKSAEITAPNPRTKAADEPRAMPSEQLELEITELASHVNAATCRWLGLVAEFDRREAWGDWGCKTCAAWLSWRCGLSPAAAREQLRVARKLVDLPVTRATFGRGELSYSQVRALTRIAAPETEADLVELARHSTASQLEVVVRAYRGVLDRELGDRDAAHRRRYVRCEHDDDGSLIISARLPAEEGALVLAALEAGRDALRAGGPEGASAEGASAEITHSGDEDEPSAPEKQSASNADALVLMSETLLHAGKTEGNTADLHQVVVHIDAEVLAGTGAGASEDGACQLEHGPALEPETARRLACDASIVRIIERDGRPLSVGRKTRSVPPALRRALRTRDGTCRFPGCQQRRFLHAHHIDHWARGGRTDLQNLVQLCAHHHRLVHDGGYRIERRARGELCFRRPDGRAVPCVPKRTRGTAEDVRRGNREQVLTIGSETCVPRWWGDRLDPPWVVDGLIERDPRFRSPKDRPEPVGTGPPPV